MNTTRQRLKYILSDYITASIAWLLFFIFRKIYIEESGISARNFEFRPDHNFYLGITIIPLFWILLYYSLGHYRHIYRRSRLEELIYTFQTIVLGVILLFFVLILDDVVHNYGNYYQSLLMLFCFQFFITYIPRLFITTHTNNLIQKGKIWFNTILIGGNGKATKIFEDINSQERKTGNKLVGFLSVRDVDTFPLEKKLAKLGSSEDIVEVINEHKIEEVIIALDPKEHEQINSILNSLEGCNVNISSIPSMYDILAGKVKMSAIFGTPLLKLSHDLLPPWQQRIKTSIDFVGSLLALTVSLPIMLFLAIAIKVTSKGPVFYSHERLGKHGKPFKIHKFRSMYLDAEAKGPQLSTENDPRITPIGRFMRKMRFDEIPNFINVLKGEMSLVGPRPEREFYAKQLLEEAPHYKHLQKVKPGITSWGQVKYGYASNIPEMLKRLQYDILYIENMSLFVDFKILIYTVITILQRKGK